LLKVYISENINPSFNLALEEYLVRRHDPSDRILFLWQNQNTVVIGRNQNPWKECNIEELKRQKGQLVRRLSGGGAVYHDSGNLNFTFISAYTKTQVTENIGLLIQVLAQFGIEAVFSGKNDILVQDSKISGNAFFVEDDILCHHGTLLVDVDIEKLGRLLTVSEKKLRSKGVDSVRSRVRNLIEFNRDLSINDLRENMLRTFLSDADEIRIHLVSDKLTEDEEIELGDVQKLMERYESWEWTFGSTPEFNIEISERFNWGGIDLYLLVKDGIITNIEINTDALDVNLPRKIIDMVCNTKYDHDSLIGILNTF